LASSKTAVLPRSCPAALLPPEEEGDRQFPTGDNKFPAKEGELSLVQIELMEVARLLKISSGTGGFADKTKKVESKEARESLDVKLEGVEEIGNNIKKSQKGAMQAPLQNKKVPSE
jgi:hypothetical protein